MPGAVIYGPLERGGMEMLESYALQDQLYVMTLMKHIRWRQKVVNDILVTLDNIQLAVGFIRPVLADTRLRLDYIDQGWIVSLRKILAEIEAGIWIEEA